MAARLAELFAKREERDSQRLAQILDFAGQSGCITRRLLAYFGETLDEANCGHCHYCRTGVPSEPVRLPATAVAPFTEAHAAEVRALMAEGNRPLSTPRQVTRFLCGLTSPATTRAKLTRRPEFGRFSTVPFRTVLEWVEGEISV